MQPTDDPGPGAGAGISPTDPGTPGNRRAGADEAGDATVDDDELVSAVEDLVRDLLTDGDAPRG